MYLATDTPQTPQNWREGRRRARDEEGKTNGKTYSALREATHTLFPPTGK